MIVTRMDDMSRTCKCNLRSWDESHATTKKGRGKLRLTKNSYTVPLRGLLVGCRPITHFAEIKRTMITDCLHVMR